MAQKGASRIAGQLLFLEASPKGAIINLANNFFSSPVSASRLTLTARPSRNRDHRRAPHVSKLVLPRLMRWRRQDNVERLGPGAAADDGPNETRRIERPARPGARGVQVRNLLLRSQPGPVAAIRPGLEPLAIGIESRVTPRLLSDSQGLGQLFGGRGPRGVFEQACDHGVFVKLLAESMLDASALRELLGKKW
jgi:hypothetical protein